MKIKILWGFIGNGALLGADSDKVKAGAVFNDVDDEYAHALIGKGLAEQVTGDGKPKANKPAATKPATPAESKAAGAAPDGEGDDAQAAAGVASSGKAQGEGGAAVPDTAEGK